MLYQAIIAVFLGLILLNLFLNLRALHKAKRDVALPDPAPLISILVPARNEEANIEACLLSLLKQDYPNFEILVLDDSSTDATADIVSKLAAADHRVRLLKGQPLEKGWAGKPFACHQLAQQAHGSWLLFTDADTVHAPAMLKRILGSAVASQADLVSGFPHQRTTSIWQKMALPVLFYFMLLVGLPFWWLQRSGRFIPGVAIGQFLFFSADAYRAIGGHEAVKSRIVEDVWLGIEISRHKYRQLTLDLSQLVSCQMYREFGNMWNGITRWLYTVASLSLFSFIFLMVAVMVLFLAPFLWLLYGIVLAQPALGWEFLVALQVMIVYLARFLAARRFSQPKSSILLHPVGIAFLLLVALYAGYQYITGAGVKWKDRIYEERAHITR